MNACFYWDSADGAHSRAIHKHEAGAIDRESFANASAQRSQVEHLPAAVTKGVARGAAVCAEEAAELARRIQAVDLVRISVAGRQIRDSWGGISTAREALVHGRRRDQPREKK